ncbi:Flp family type IVb pilin [Knoellia sp. DB2414S]|uniref:Flp family type IVb pilin n=2 Tax=Knoellia koreensis TaxID=2730921 RepID=A0A849HNZ9_9MICO|nr:Flp family type IVb pilin [Knoellia sp. DB2414S]
MPVNVIWCFDSPAGGSRGRLGTNRADHGATAVEYALMVSLIAVVIVGAVALFGQNMIELFNVPSSAL